MKKIAFSVGTLPRIPQPNPKHKVAKVKPRPLEITVEDEVMADEASNSSGSNTIKDTENPLIAEVILDEDVIAISDGDSEQDPLEGQVGGQDNVAIGKSNF